MNLYELYPTKELKKLKEDKTYVTENLINSLHINMPSTFGDYPIKELELELRCYLPTVNDGVTEYSEYMGYQIDVTQKVAEIPITNDITGAVQVVKVMIIATKDGNVIGKTNFVDKQIYDAPLKGDPLTPREQFDKVISEQRAEIAEQAETITEQQGTITSQGEQITELSGEVSELQGEVSEQAATITRQNTTIDELNRRVPPLETLDPINPTTEQVTYNPESPNIGFPQVIVNAPTAEGLGFDYGNLKKDVEFLGGVGTYAPKYGQSTRGFYFFDDDDSGTTQLVVRMDGSKLSDQSLNAGGYILTSLTIEGNFTSLALNDWQSIAENCTTLSLHSTTSWVLQQNNFFHTRRLKTLVLPSGLISVGYQCFWGSNELETLYIPNTIRSFSGSSNFQNASKLKNVTIESGFNASDLHLEASTLYSHDTILSWFNALADRTGETAYTLTIGSTNLNKMTAEEIAIATNKNWNLA